MSWRIVVISKRAKLDLQLGQMVVRGEEVTKIVLSEISTILIESTAVSLTASLIAELAKRKIKVIFCDEKKNPSCELVNYYGSHDTSNKIRKQIAWKQNTKEAVWTEIVTEKIRKQKEILEYIKAEILKKGYPPAVREICEAVNLKSTSSVHSHLETLERNGYIRRDPTKPRAIEICDDNFQMVRTEMVSLPVVGQVAAGTPILAEENIDSYFPVPAELVPQGESFVLKVKGDSMINVGIFSGDQIFVNACNTAHNGDTVVALIDDSATVKTFYKEDGHIRLQPENDTMDPIIVDDCQILGKVFGVFRVMK